MFRVEPGNALGVFSVARVGQKSHEFVDEKGACDVLVRI